MDFVRTDVEGIPTLWIPDGPARAGLVFRVGRADETLTTGGITHLLEHLALHRIGLSEHHYNGATAPAVTMFVAEGGATELTEFLTAVCAGLREPPSDRLATEVEIVRVEANSTRSGPNERLAAWRYGPASYGLAAYPEFGLSGLTVDDLRAWSARYFTRGNAALWFTGGAPPAGLRLDLPDGPAMPPPTATNALPRTPAYFPADLDGIAFDTVLSRSTAARAYAKVLGRRLWTVLRQEHGLSYTAAANYVPRDSEHATVVAIADALPERRGELTGPFVDVLIDLASDEVTESELEFARRDGEEPSADRAAGLVVGNAINLVLGAPLQTEERLAIERAELTAAQVREVGQAALANGLIVVPPGQAVGRAGFTQAPSTSSERVVGPEFTLVNAAAERRRLVISPLGVSITDGPNALTVRYKECAGMLAFADGGRILFAPDAVVVAVEPTLWNVPARTLAMIDQRMPADRVAHLPAREQVPSPPPAPPPPPPPSRTSRFVHKVLIPVAVVAMVLGVVTLGWFALSGGHSILPVFAAGYGAWVASRRLLNIRRP